jgi:pyridoxine 4-dehydrogenase
MMMKNYERLLLPAIVLLINLSLCVSYHTNIGNNNNHVQPHYSYRIQYHDNFIKTTTKSPPFSSSSFTFVLHMRKNEKQQENEKPIFVLPSWIQNNTRSNNKKQTYDVTRIPIVGRYSNCTISSLGCGTWSWGNRFLYNYNDKKNDIELYQAYQVVRDAGVTFFDTADSYGTLNYNGRAEILLGQFERQYQSNKMKMKDNHMNQNKEFPLQLPWMKNQNRNEKETNIRQVATKLAPYPWRITRNSVINAAKGSLRRIQEDSVYMAQLHWSTQKYQPIQERVLWDSLCDLYDLKLCDTIGVSNYGPIQLMKIQNYIQTQRCLPGIATAQIQYSLLTYADPLTRDMETICSESNIKLISYSPLCLGLLSGKYTIDNVNSIASYPRRQLFRELLPSSTPLLKALQVMATDNNVSISQIAINWCLCKNTIPIPGCRTMQQANEIINAATTFRLRPDEMNELDSIAKAVSKPMIQNIFQTK